MSTDSDKLVVIDATKQAGSEQPKRDYPIPQGSSTKFVRSLTRFAIGSAALGMKMMKARLRDWEAEILETTETEPDATTTPLVSAAEWQAVETESASRRLRFLLLGVLFEAPERFIQGGQAVSRKTEKAVSLAMTPLRYMPVPGIIRRRVDRLAQRGGQEAKRLIALGRAEEAHSERLAQIGIDNLMESGIDMLAESESLQELVHEQSLGLADEALEEVRERTVTGDILLERMIRRLFRRPPREILPQPTQIIAEMNRAAEEDGKS